MLVGFRGFLERVADAALVATALGWRRRLVCGDLEIADGVDASPGPLARALCTQCCWYLVRCRAARRRRRRSRRRASPRGLRLSRRPPRRGSQCSCRRRSWPGRARHVKSLPVESTRPRRCPERLVSIVDSRTSAGAGAVGRCHPSP